MHTSRLIVLYIISCFALKQTIAQTPNDNMVEAIELSIDRPYSSKTDGNTVQYACINTALTGKCIKYHNDQWFTFNTELNSSLFINVVGQQCRDLLGIQLVIIDGELCEPDNYQIIDCISLATQDDIYVALDGLKQHHTYWLNIDGYLHDYCQFEIEVATQPKGISVEKEKWLKHTEVTSEEHLVTLQWQLNDSISNNLRTLHILRRPSNLFKFESIAKIDIAFNAFGRYAKDYQYVDTLYQPGSYFYRIAVEDQNGRMFLLEELEFNLSAQSLKKIVLDLDYEYYDLLEIKLYDEIEGTFLAEWPLTYSEKKHRNYIIYTQQYFDKGVRELRVEIFNKSTRHHQMQYFKLGN